jgi:mRNA interferase MazF
MKGGGSKVPVLGAVGWLVFDPQAGRGQAGRRPAVVLSHTRDNDKTGLAVFCAITCRMKGYPFELALPEGLPVAGVVLCDQVRSLDWRERQWQPLGQVPEDVLDAVMGKMLTLFKLPGR